MRNWKLFNGFLVIVLAGAMLSGCGGKQAQTMKTAVEPGKDGKITAQPLELTVFEHEGGRAFSYEKATMFQEAFKKTNIKLRNTSSEANSDDNQEFNLMLTSSPLPDIIQGNKVNINPSAVQGALIPLDDLINQYAPHIKQFLDENPWARKGSLASDGKLYYIPHIYEGKPSMGFYVRQDWLDKLKLKAPATVQEYHDVLKAFREKDPNGNGVTDEVPYFYRDKGVDGLLQLWGAKDNWYVDENDRVIHGKTQPAYKLAMINLANWYKEGLIDKEIYSRGKQSREILLGDNVGGSTHDWFTSTGSFNHTLKDKIPGFSFVAIPPPADSNGVVKEEASRDTLNGRGWGISKDNQYPVETIKYFDFWFTQEGAMLYSYGIEGVDYNIVDGKPVYTDIIKYAEGSPQVYMQNTWGGFEFGAVSRIDAEIQLMGDDARQGFQMYAENNYCTDRMPNLSFNPDEERIVKEKEQAISTYMREVQQKWLFGNESVEDGFDAYIAQVKAMGYDDLQAAYQSAYDRYLKQ